MIDEIKWAYQRVIRGYDDRVCWNLDVYFLNVIPAVKQFCIEELKNTATKDLNPKRYEIYTETLRRIDIWEKSENDKTYHHNDIEAANLLEYIGENIGYFWD